MEAFKLGANDYMTKPFIPNELIIRIRKEALR
jgi:DNA-binding response OmpR family regulator